MLVENLSFNMPEMRREIIKSPLQSYDNKNIFKKSDKTSESSPFDFFDFKNVLNNFNLNTSSKPLRKTLNFNNDTGVKKEEFQLEHIYKNKDTKSEEIKSNKNINDKEQKVNSRKKQVSRNNKPKEENNYVTCSTNYTSNEITKNINENSNKLHSKESKKQNYNNKEINQINGILDHSEKPSDNVDGHINIKQSNEEVSANIIKQLDILKNKSYYDNNKQNIVNNTKQSTISNKMKSEKMTEEKKTNTQETIYQMKNSDNKNMQEKYKEKITNSKNKKRMNPVCAFFAMCFS